MDRKQARAFEGFVTESGDALLRMATLLTSDPGVAEDVYQETLHRLAQRWSRVGSHARDGLGRPVRPLSMGRAGAGLSDGPPCQNG